MRLTHTVALAVCSFVGAVAMLTAQGDGDRTAAQTAAAQSVLRIEATFGGSGVVSQGSGFVWKDGLTAVTALHVVAGANAIRVSAENPDSTIAPSAATLIGANLTADLALLRLGRDLGRRPLAIAPATPDVTHFIFGFPQAAPRIWPKAVRVEGDLEPGAKPTFASIYSKNDFARMVGDQPYPQYTAEIWKVGGGLTHGYSGAPIINRSGQVVAIGDGGLKEGLEEFGFAISAAPYLRDPSSFSAATGVPPSHATTLASAVVSTPTKIVVEQAPAKPQARTSSRRPKPTLQLEWSATLKEILDTLPQDETNGRNYDEFKELARMIEAAAVANTRIDVYQDDETGATIAVPHGLKFDFKDGVLGTGSQNGNVEMVVGVANGDAWDDGFDHLDAFQKAIEGRSRWQSLDPDDDIEDWSDDGDVYISKTVVRRTRGSADDEFAEMLAETLIVQESEDDDATDFLGTAVVLHNGSRANAADRRLFYIMNACVRLATLGAE